MIALLTLACVCIASSSSGKDGAASSDSAGRSPNSNDATRRRRTRSFSEPPARRPRAAANGFRWPVLPLAKRSSGSCSGLQRAVSAPTAASGAAGRAARVAALRASTSAGQGCAHQPTMAGSSTDVPAHSSPIAHWRLVLSIIPTLVLALVAWFREMMWREILAGQSEMSSTRDFIEHALMQRQSELLEDRDNLQDQLSQIERASQMCAQQLQSVGRSSIETFNTLNTTQDEADETRSTLMWVACLALVLAVSLASGLFCLRSYRSQVALQTEQIQQMTDELYEAQAAGDDQFKCVVCLNAPRTNLYPLCNHLCTCDECAQGMVRARKLFCPICKRAGPTQRVQLP